MFIRGSILSYHRDRLVKMAGILYLYTVVGKRNMAGTNMVILNHA